MRNKLFIAAVSLTSLAGALAADSELPPQFEKLYKDTQKLDTSCTNDLAREINKSLQDRRRMPNDLLLRLTSVHAALGNIRMAAEVLKALYSGDNAAIRQRIGGDDWLIPILRSDDTDDAVVLEDLRNFFSQRNPGIAAKIQKKLNELQPPPPKPSVSAGDKGTPASVESEPMMGSLKVSWIQDAIMARMEFVSPRRASLGVLSDSYASQIEELGTGRRLTRMELLQDIKKNIDYYSPRAVKLLSVGVHATEPLIEINIAYVFKADKNHAARTRAKDKSGYQKVILRLDNTGKINGLDIKEEGMDKPQLSPGYTPFPFEGDDTVLSE